MVDLSDEYFEHLFDNLLRESLASRRKRKALVEHLKSQIEKQTSAGERGREDGCRTAVSAIIRYHKKSVAENGFVCLLGKYHNVLYLAVKLCYDFRLSGTELVSELLKEIFRCENTFERIWAGAIYGVTVAHFIAGWKSDFQDQKENISAAAYFLEEASKRKLVFRIRTDSGTEMKKFADVPMNPANRAPLVAALQMLNVEIVLLLLRFDASYSFRFFEVYPAGEEISEKELDCMNVLLRAVPSVYSLDRKFSRYEDLNCLNLSKRSDFVPFPQLKHLCRCQIRKVLRSNSMLPLGIPSLGLPKSVSDYLDLFD